MRTGLALGVNYSKPTLPVILGAGISMRGNKMEAGGMDVTNSFTYLDLSAIYPYELGPGKVWAGLDIGMNLSAKYEVEYRGVAAAVLTAAGQSTASTETDIDAVTWTLV